MAKGNSILVVDDEPPIRRFLRTSLVAAAPPLTDAQRDRLAALLRSPADETVDTSTTKPGGTS